MFLKQKINSALPTGISLEESFCVNHYTRVWMREIPSSLREIESEIRLKCGIDPEKKCVFSLYTSVPGGVWEVKTRDEKFEKNIILSTHPIVENRGEINIQGGEYIIIPPGQGDLHFLPNDPTSTLMVFSYCTPSEKRKNIDSALTDLMS